MITNTLSQANKVSKVLHEPTNAVQAGHKKNVRPVSNDKTMKKLIAAILMLLAFAYASNFDYETAQAEQAINQQTTGK